MKISIFQDTVCPWCRIGKKYLKEAIQQWEQESGQHVEIEYHAYLLNPDIPNEGKPFKKLIEEKMEGFKVEEVFHSVVETGKNVGFHFDFQKIEVMPNTIASHQLIKLTPPEKQEEMIDAIYEAYFDRGINIGDLDELLKIAVQHGLDQEEVRHQLTTEAHINEVQKDLDLAREYQIRGVPFIVINDELGLSGAQSPESILRVFRETQGNS
ncbi:DsbA family oxidoreductase [Hazenella coriacea]|uniref:Putative DsbA family dithiol-disulfide isomerase n=1 Tax=Hazenella coriacea TaxID=1179467 RepID=A0A4R3L4T1_9BACL|nr:DsbA family oxidoreductase [Hazenella coriacea]TCS93965.1 putative DsbA family dithiol-disulfide isomerase [Hazenella coriacea]